MDSIVISKFGELRGNNMEKHDKLDNFCLVCGIERSTIDKHAHHKRGFSYHISNEQNLYN